MKPKKAPNCLKKNWIHHNMDHSMTTIIRFVEKKDDGNYVLAVGRAYKSPIDKNYSRKIGRETALSRIQKYFRMWNLTNVRNDIVKDSISHFVYGNDYAGRPDRKNYRAFDSKVIFAIGDETILTLPEMELWHNKILPKIERELED